MSTEEEKVTYCVEVLHQVLQQACGYEEEGVLKADSMALSAYAKGLRLLAEYGLFEIEKATGRRVIGVFKEK